MQKQMMPFYGLQLLLTLFTTFSFANLIPYLPMFSPIHVAFWIWIGFIFPLQIATVVWGEYPKEILGKTNFCDGELSACGDGPHGVDSRNVELYKVTRFSTNFIKFARMGVL